MQAVLVLRVTTIVENGETKFSLNMPIISMEAPQDPAKDTDLAEVKVVNESNEDIVLAFPGTSPCDPATIPIDENSKQLLKWEDKVDKGKYYFLVSQQETDSGGNVRPTMGTIDIVVMG